MSVYGNACLITAMHKVSLCMHECLCTEMFVLLLLCIKCLFVYIMHDWLTVHLSARTFVYVCIFECMHMHIVYKMVYLIYMHVCFHAYAYFVCALNF